MTSVMLPAGFDPACPACNHGGHACRGCGDYVPHGTIACAPCNAEPDGVRPVPATSPLAEPVPAAVALDGTPAESWLAALRHADAQIAQATGIRGRAIEHLQAAMGDATEATVAGRTVITWRHSKPGRTLDRNALEAAYGADVIASFDRDKKAARPFKPVDEDGA